MMTDDDMLNALGVSHEEMVDLQAKHAQFIASLNPAQKKVMQKTLPDLKSAAGTFGPGVTAARLEKFIRARAPRANSTLIVNEGVGVGRPPKKK